MNASSDCTGVLTSSGATGTDVSNWLSDPDQQANRIARNAGFVLGMAGKDEMGEKGSDGRFYYSHQAIHALIGYLEKNHLPGRAITGNLAINAAIGDAQKQSPELGDLVTFLKRTEDPVGINSGSVV